MKLSVVVPAYNEAERILKNIESIKTYLVHKKIQHEIIVVDDGSTDNTLKILRTIKNIKIIHYNKNKGKGYAVRKGVLTAKGTHIFMCDADLSMPIENLSEFLKRGEDIVIGSRAMKGSKVKTSAFKRIAGRIGNLFISLLAVKNIHDTQCGFKLFTNKAAKTVFEHATIDRWGFDFEILHIAQKKKLSIKEIPILWNNRKESSVKLSDYPKTLFELFRIKINDIRGLY